MSLTFSIVTPSLNQGKFIEQSICSVLSQAGDFFVDYIIMDGGSNDETLTIVKKYEMLLKEKQWTVNCCGISFRWFSESDRGQSHAINKGFALAKGEILGWLNSDDCYLDGAFSYVAEVNWEKNDFCYGKGEWVGKQGDCLGEYPTFSPNRYSLYFQCTLCQPTVFIKRGSYHSLGALSLDYELVFDYEYWLRAVFDGAKFARISSFIAKSRIYPENKSLSFPLTGDRERRTLLERYYSELRLSGFLKFFWRQIVDKKTRSVNNKLIKMMEKSGEQL